MLRIHIDHENENTSFVLEGKLMGLWVTELENCWQAEQGKSVVVNLTAVDFVDQEGLKLLRRMCKQGVRFIASGILMNATVESLEREAGQEDCF